MKLNPKRVAIFIGNLVEQTDEDISVENTADNQFLVHYLDEHGDTICILHHNG